MKNSIHQMLVLAAHQHRITAAGLRMWRIPFILACLCPAGASWLGLAATSLLSAAVWLCRRGQRSREGLCLPSRVPQAVFGQVGGVMRPAGVLLGTCSSCDGATWAQQPVCLHGAWCYKKGRGVLQTLSDGLGVDLRVIWIVCYTSYGQVIPEIINRDVRRFRIGHIIIIP